jgi:hypothetical protein
MQRLTVSGYIGHSEDVDIFRTPATYGGYLLDFSVELYDLPADYDLYVYDSANREIARSTNRGTEPEHIYYYSGPRTGNGYWLKVVGADGASDPNRPYRLRFTMNPGTRTPSPTRTPTVLPTATPDPCTGWRCVVTGVVYAGTAQPGDELAGATITLHHTSYCSPTSGVHQAKTGPTALLNSAMCSCTTRIESRSKSNPRGTNPPSGTLSIATASTVVALGIRSRLCCAQCQVHKKNGVVAHYLTSGYTPRTKRTGMASC